MDLSENVLHASFNGSIRAVDEDVLSKMGVSQASINENAAPLFPEGFDKNKNVDVLPVVFNLAVVNQFNKNGDGIDAKTAMAAVKHFINKPINVEHKKDKIVGHILNASFSYDEQDFKDNDLEAFASETKPFYITAAGVIYRKIFPKLAAAIIKASDEESPEYKSICTSWEIAFKEFLMTKGSSMLEDCTIISDPDEIAKAKKCHKAFGGKGVDENGVIINRWIVGETLPLGAGLTYAPAASVEGVFVVEDFEEEDDLEETDDDEEENSANNKQKNSLITKNVVRIGKFKEILNMDNEQFDKFLQKLEESVASIGTAGEGQTKSVGLVVKDALVEYNKVWENKVEAEKQSAAADKQALASLQEQFQAVQSELATLKQEQETQAAASLFNQRMNFIDETYVLGEDEIKLVTEELKAVASTDEAFDAFKNKIGILFGHKSKASIAANEKAIADRIEEEVAKRSKSLESNASTTDNKEENQEDLEIEETQGSSIPNNNEGNSKQESLIEKFRKSFEVKVEI